MVSLRLKTSREPTPDVLALPWTTPLDAWPDDLAVRLPTGRHRHVVRFIEHEQRYFACKELPPRLAHREFEMLEFLKEEGVPVVDLVGVADQRVGDDGQPLEAVLITRHLPYSLPYMQLFMGPGAEGLHDRILDALAALLVRIHLNGFYWGDCSLNNALFRRDAGALVAYLVDTETGELHDDLTDGQRSHDLDIAVENIVGGLFELEAMGRLAAEVDPVATVEQLRLRYDALWEELTRVDQVASTQLWRINARLERLNDLGFDTAEMELADGDGHQSVRFRPTVVEAGHHARELKRLAGVDAQENQARRLLGAIHAYGAWLSGQEGRDLPEALVAYRWLTERYEPTIAAVPDDLDHRLEPAELYHQILEHAWFLSERAGEDVGLPMATRSFVSEVLPTLPATETILPTDDGDAGEEIGSGSTRV